MVNKNAIIITGANGGIGSCICKELANAGYYICGIDLGASSSHEYTDSYISANLNDNQSIQLVIEKLNQMSSSISWYGLINNAGLYRALEFQKTTYDDFEQVLSINIKAPFFLSQWLASCINKNNRSGAIVNIGSISGRNGSKDVCYGVSKGAINNLTKSLSLALSPNIRVNEVSPGVVDTKMASKIPAERLEEYKIKTLNGRIGKPEDISGVVAFLMSDKAIHINGVSLAVDGGQQ